jgi:hypothetical protein
MCEQEDTVKLGETLLDELTTNCSWFRITGFTI